MKKCWLFALILVAIVSAVTAKEHSLAAKTIAIDGGPESFFHFANAMLLKEDRLFLLENMRHRALAFRLQGDRAVFVKSFGKKGEGPGDLCLPFLLSTDGQMLAIRDEKGVSFFSQDGDFRSRFKRPFFILSGEYSQGVYYALTVAPDSNHLIRLLSESGKEIAAMLPRYLEIDPAKNEKIDLRIVERHFYGGKLMVDRDGIYYLNSAFATLCRLDRSGKILKTVSLEAALSKGAVEDIQKNRKMLRDGLEVEFQPEGGMIMRDSHICRSACMFKGKLFLMDREEDGSVRVNPAGKKTKELCIRSIDLKTMRPDDVYRFEIDKDAPLIQSFTVGEEDGNVYFLVCQEIGEESGIVKYSIRKPAT